MALTLRGFEMVRTKGIFVGTLCASGIVLAGMLMSFGALAAQAPDPVTAQGVAWLQNQVQTDGSLTNEAASMATPMQARSETAVTLAALASAPASLTQSVNGIVDPVTEYEARRVWTAAAVHAAPTLSVADLLAFQNDDGGFGGAAGYSSSPLDTAFALLALHDLGGVDTNTIGAALGYLQSSEHADGGWGVGDQSSVYVTSYVLMALQPWGTHFSITSLATSAQNWLLANRNGSRQYDAVLDNILALLALPTITADSAALAPLQQAVQAGQSSDGSWSEDPYVTALALRSLQTAAQPNPNQTTVVGRVVDGQTQLPLAGASVTFVGPQSYSQTTDSDGHFAFTNVVPGAYSLTVADDGFNSVTGTTTASTGQALDFGTIALLSTASSSGGATTGTVQGAVSDSTTHQPIAGATVTANGLIATTATDGTYEIPGVEAGTVNVSASAAGYQTVIGTGTLPAGGIVLFSPQLNTGSASGSGAATLLGTVTNANTGTPISGAAISVTGANNVSAQTDASGAYEIDGLVPGTAQIVVSATGYDSVGATTQFQDNTSVTFSPKLYPTNNSPPGANTAGINGTVVDSTTNQPLANVAIVVTLPDNTTQNISTDSGGHFAVTGLTQNQIGLDFSLSGFVSTQFSAWVVPLQNTDIGQVRLRPEGVLQLLPDLVVDSVDSKTQAITDPQSLQLSGTVQVVVGNRGTAPVPAGATVFAFYDANLNGVYDAGTDVALGSATTSAAIDPQGTGQVDVPVSGTMPFRDAPVSVWVDSTQTVVELDESNNYGSSTSQCRIAPPPTTIQPKLKWAWRGSPTDQVDVNVFGPAVVGHLTDDNGDGRYDQNDIPSLVFAAGSSILGLGTNVLVAVSGKDGHELWRRTDLNVTNRGSAAIADINGDGKPEVLITDANRTRLIALRNDGSVLWNVPTGGQNAYSSSETVSDGIAVADLNQDGNPKIILGKRVFDNKGNLLWVGQGDQGGANQSVWTDYGFLPLAADVRPDIPGMEVVAGRTLYGADGHIIWNRTDIACDGFNAVADFGYPNPPQIVLVSCGTLYLLDRDGKTIWHTAIAGGSPGGPPTVADFTGEGKPQIGVAAAYNYGVYGADGSIRWTSPTHDTSSAVTGSSAFDFLSNGRKEVLYADEHNLYIYDGATGSTLVTIPNPSNTTLEYPIVADIDNDGHADIVLSSNYSSNFPQLTTRGVRVFSAATGGWAPTRTIWNEHTYHVTNINDDGSVPQVEEPSWTHSNTYRLNTFLNQGVLDGPDLTAGLLKVTDNGSGQSPTLSARIGNGGQIASKDTTVAFYAGDPASGGTLLGSLPFAALDPAQYRDVQLPGVSNVPAGTQAIYVVVDPDNLVDECDKANNTDQIPYAAGNVLAQLSVATDQSSYGPNSPAQLTGTVTNAGGFATILSVDLRVEDSAGNIVVDFGSDALGSVSSGATVVENRSWNTGTTLAGPYVLHGLLYSSDNGSLIAEARAPFMIADNSTATSTLHTDKQVYNPSDQVQILSGVQSLSANVILSNLKLNLQVVDATGAQQFAHSDAIAQLLPGAFRAFSVPDVLANAAAGTYTVKQDLLDASNNLLNHVETTFKVASTSVTGIGLVGTIAAAPKSLPVGATVAFNATATNQGNGVLTDLPLTISIVDTAAGTLLAQLHQTATIATGITVPFVTTWVTQGTANTTYTAVLSATLGSGANAKTLTLASDTFTLTISLKVNVSLTAGTPPLAALVLLDPSANPADATAISAALAAHGYVATFVTTATDFASSVRTGAYQLYLLLANSVMPDTTTQRLLREGVHRGEGVIIANGAGQLTDALAQISGLQSGSLPVINAQAIDVLANAPGSAAHVALDPPLASRIVVPQAAQTQATLTGRLPAVPDQGTIAAEVAALGRVDIGYFGSDAGTNGTGLSLTAEGVIQNPDGSTATVWLIRNSGTTARNVILASTSGGYSLALTITPQTDTFIASPVVADHSLSENGTVIQTTSATTTVFADSRLVDVGANPGAIALWANHINATDVLDWNGAQHVLHGAIHSNSDIVLTGAKNLIDGPVHYVTSLRNNGSQNTFTYLPRPVTAQPLPTLQNLADFAPGGAVATAVGVQYHDETAQCGHGGKWHLTPKDMPLPAGVYYAPCDIQIDGDSPGGNVTLVGTGAIQISGSKGAFTPFYQGVQFASTLAGTAIHLSGSNTSVGGLVFAPNGAVQIDGSSMSFACSIIADTIRLSGAKTLIDARQCAYATVQKQTPAVLFNPFGQGAGVYAAFPWQAAIDQYEANTPGELTSLFGGVLGEIAPNQIVLRTGSIVPLTAQVDNLADPFQGQLALGVDDDSVFVPPTASWQLSFTPQAESFKANSNVRLGSGTSTGVTATASAASPVVINPLKQATATIGHLAGDTIADVIGAVSATANPDAGLSNALTALNAAQTAQTAGDAQGELEDLLYAAEACGTSTNAQAAALRTRIDWVVWAATH